MSGNGITNIEISQERCFIVTMTKGSIIHAGSILEHEEVSKETKPLKDNLLKVRTVARDVLWISLAVLL